MFKFFTVLSLNGVDITIDVRQLGAGGVMFLTTSDGRKELAISEDSLVSIGKSAEKLLGVIISVVEESEE